MKKFLTSISTLGLIIVLLVGIYFVYTPGGENRGKSGVPPAPGVLYIKVGEEKNIRYWGHNISVSYLSADPHRVIVKVDGKVIKEIVKNVTDYPRGVYWNYNDLHFELKPVIWKKNPEGKIIPYYEVTWNTTELLFEVWV